MSELATRLYLRAFQASEPKPIVRQSAAPISEWILSTLGGGQDGAGAIYPLDMLTVEGSDDAQSIRETRAEPGSAHYSWFKAWISPALDGQTISGTLTVVLDWNEGSFLHNTFPRIFVYVWKGDNTGLRGILYAETDSGTEADITDASLQTFFNGVALSSVACQAGDRIVIEVMGYDNNTKRLSFLHAINFDGPAGGNRESYVEFSQTLAFQPVYTSYGLPFLYESENWPGARFCLEVYMRASIGTVKARLYNETDSAEVPGSVLSTSLTSFQRLRSPELALVSGKVYKVQFGRVIGNAGAFTGSKLIAI